MRLAIISFSRAGEALAGRIAGSGKLAGEIRCWTKSRFATEPMQATLAEWTEARFADSDGLLFIGACGIAVRAIAPYVRSKKTDPAVLVMDDCGRFVISLLSGHLGGANALAEQVSRIVGATPVITTGTDVHGRIAPDLLADRNDCSIDDMTAAKDIAAAIVAGRPVGLASVLEIEGAVPPELTVVSRRDCPSPVGSRQVQGFAGDGQPAGGQVEQRPQAPREGISISPWLAHETFPDQTLWLIPRCLILGIGCKKGTPQAQIAATVATALETAGLDMRAVEQVASIDLKAEEAGLVEFCRQAGLPFVTYSAEALQAVRGAFSASAFVQRVTGVDNVCERSALLAAGEEGQILLRKYSGDGVTIAAAMRKRRICIE